MKSSMNITNSLSLLSEMKNDKVQIQVLEYEKLKGSSDLKSAFMLRYMNEAGIRLRQVRIVLNNGGAYAQKGALSYLRGPVSVSANTGGLTSLAKKVISGSLTNEHAIKPLYIGTGEILLQPSFNHYLILELEDESEEIIFDNSMFFCAQEGMELSARAIKSVSGALFGKEGLFQTSLKGKGLAVLQIPVPEAEILKFKLKDDTLKVDGNFAILRSSGIDFTVEAASDSLASSAITGEGLVNVFRGSGEVWLMQTKKIYDELSEAAYDGFLSSTINKENDNSAQ